MRDAVSRCNGFLSVFLSLCSVFVGCNQKERETLPCKPQGFLVSPSRKYIAFSLESYYGRPYPVIVVDSQGREVAVTSPPHSPPAHDYPVAWTKDGTSILCCRHRLTGEDGFTTEMLWLQVEPMSPAEVLPSLEGFVSGYIIDRSTIVCRSDGLDAEVPAGQYVLRLEGGDWRAKPLLLDSAETKWLECLWGRLSEEGLTVIVRAEGGSGSPPATVFRRVVWDMSSATPDSSSLYSTSWKVYRVSVLADGSQLLVMEYPSRADQCPSARARCSRTRTST